jgi:4a-hydroxytetrahydrobiopterin dehydratase
MADLLKADEAKARLKKIPEWELEKKHIERTFEFDDFSESIDFVNGVAEVAADEEHHPDIDIRYNKVRLVLTHSRGGLTDLDFGLAEGSTRSPSSGCHPLSTHAPASLRRGSLSFSRWSPSGSSSITGISRRS